MTFQVTVNQREPGVFMVSVVGSLDSTTHDVFEKKLAPIGFMPIKVIVLDLAGVDYVSSLGIGSVFKIIQMAKPKGGTVLMANLQPKVKKVFDIVKALPGGIFKSIEEADEYIDALQKEPPAK